MFLGVTFLVVSPEDTLSSSDLLQYINPKEESLWVDQESARRLQDLFRNSLNIKIACRFRGEDSEEEDYDFLVWSVQTRMSQITTHTHTEFFGKRTRGGGFGVGYRLTVGHW